MNKCISCLEPAKELNKGYCGKCETVINNRLQKARSGGDQKFKRIFDLKIHPEEMPTCHSCGGQKQHPTKLFTYPPENGLCDNELEECNIEEICVSCGTDENVCSCWNCDINLCIDCDAGEMRTDFDGHTYCDNCEPK